MDMLLQDTQYQGTYFIIIIKSYAQVSFPSLLDWSRTRLLDQLVLGKHLRQTLHGYHKPCCAH